MTTSAAFTINRVTVLHAQCDGQEQGRSKSITKSHANGIPNGKRALVLGQKSGVAHAINPDQQGEVLWQRSLGKGGASRVPGGGHASLRRERQRVYP